MAGVSSPNTVMSIHAAMWDVSRENWKNSDRIDGIMHAISRMSFQTSVRPMSLRKHAPRVRHVYSATNSATDTAPATSTILNIRMIRAS